MNSDKTKVIWIGRKKLSKDKLDVNCNLVWGNTVFVLLGLKFNVNLNDMLDLNFEHAIAQIKNIFNHWNKRYLTPIGKITVIKTFAISKITHLLATLPDPSENTLKRINKLLFQFLWDNKPEKIKRHQATQSYYQGGLNMINLEHTKVSWPRRLLQIDNSPWAQLFESTITSRQMLFELGRSNTVSILQQCKNMFWKDVLKSWIHLSKLNSTKSYLECLTSPLWLNPDISEYQLYIPNWFKNKISIVNDLIDTDGSVKNLQKIIDQYNVDNIDFLTYHRLKLSIINYKAKHNRPTIDHNFLQLPTIPLQLCPLINQDKGTKRFYAKFNAETKKVYINEKWNRTLNLDFDDKQWKVIYKICFKSVQDNYLIWLQYKILNNILGVNRFLHKIKVSMEPNCRLCNDEDESIIHLYCNCRKVEPLWNNLSNWIRNKLTYQIHIDNQTIIFGHLDTINKHIPLNTILLVAKGYIFWCARSRKDPDIFQLQKWVKRVHDEQKAIAYKNFRHKFFHKNWNIWSTLFD